MIRDRRTTKVRSLRQQLTFLVIGVLSAGIAASFAFFYFEAHRITDELDQRSLFGQSRLLWKKFVVMENGRVTIKIPPSLERAYSDPAGMFAYTFFDAERRPILLSPNLDAPLSFNLKPQSHFVAVVASVSPSGHILIVSRQDSGAAAIARELVQEDEINFVIIWLVLTFLLAIPMIWLVVGRNLRPLRRVSAQAAAIRPHRIDAQIITDDLPSEVEPLVLAFDDALKRLSVAYQSERRFTADAAHELRTPIAILNLRLQRAQLTGHIDWPAITRDMGQLRRLLDQLLDMARKEQIDDAGQERVCLSRVVREAAAVILPIAEEKDREIEVDVLDNLNVIGSADNLRDMVRNLLENALSHGAGKITVVLGPGSCFDCADDSAVLEITDEGAGVPPAMRELVFERFSKALQNSSGTGLGLAIVRRIVSMHKGSVSFLTVPSGCCVRVVLPGAVALS